jgi:hypothetical protein
MSALNAIEKHTYHSPKETRLMLERHSFLADEICILCEMCPTKEIHPIVILIGKGKIAKMMDLGAVTITENVLNFDIEQLFKTETTQQ